MYRDIRILLITLVILGIGILIEHFVKKSNKFQDRKDVFPIVYMLGALIALNFYLLYDKWFGAGLYFNGMEIFTIGRFLPNIDAQAFYNCSQQVAETGSLNEWALFIRSLCCVYYGVVLKLTGHHLYNFYLVMCLISAVSIYSCAYVIWIKRGLLMALGIGIFLSLMYSSYSGLFMSEQSGFIFGNFAFAYLLFSLYEKKPIHAYAGLIFLGISFSFRPGALLIIPLILIYLSWYFRKQNLLNWRFGIIATLLVFVALQSNSLANKFLNPETKIQRGNFAYYLYGLASGGNNWMQILKDHPYLNDLSYEESTKEMYRLTWDKIKANPGDLVKGVFTHYKFFASKPFYVIGNSVNLDSKKLLAWLFVISIILALARSFYRRKLDPDEALVLLCFAGVFLSFPLNKIGLENINYRILAGSSLVPAFILSYGFIVFSDKWSFLSKEHSSPKSANIAIHTGALMTALILVVGILVLKFQNAQPELEKFATAESLTDSLQCINKNTIVFSKGIQVHITDQCDGRDGFCISKEKFLENTTKSWIDNKVEINDGDILFLGTKIENASGLHYLLDESEASNLGNGLTELCIEDIKEKTWPLLVSARVSKQMQWDQLRK